MESLDLVYSYLQTEIDPAFAARAKNIVKYVHKVRPKRLLDVGCGRGFYIKLLSLFDFIDELVGVDLNEKYLAVARSITEDDQRIKVQPANIYNLPLRSNYFDFIICSEVLEHVADDKRAVDELYRVMKTGGHLAVTVPNKNFPFCIDPINWTLTRLFNTHIDKNRWWLAGMWADHERLYSKKSIRRLLNRRFKIELEDELVHWCWPFTSFALYGVGKNLIERCNVSGFSRFEFSEKNFAAKLLAKLSNLPSLVLDSRLKTNTSVNLSLLVQK